MEITIKEPYYSLILSGEKTIEGRLNRGQFERIQTGQIIRWVNQSRSVATKVQSKRIYSSFLEMLVAEGLRNVLPNITLSNLQGLTEGKNVYRKFYSKDKESQFGVVAIQIKVI